MSEPTYAITTECHPNQMAPVRWSATITRLADDMTMATVWHATEEEVVENAQAWIAGEYERRPGTTRYASERGLLCDPPVPQSLRPRSVS
jgi:hypothetical protein